MNNLIRHAHRYIFNVDEFDSATIGSIILGIGDIVWLSHDIMKNGMTHAYVIIALLFLVGNILLIVGLRQHHSHLHQVRAARKAAKKEFVKALEDSANTHL
jgi:hypothetical protein